MALKATAKLEKHKFHNTPEGRKAKVIAALTGPTPKELGHGTNDPAAIQRANANWGTAEVFTNPKTIETLRADTNAAISACIEVAYNDIPTANSFKPKGSIRHVSRVAEIVAELLAKLDHDPNLIKIMCIGDIKAPSFLKKALKNVFNNASMFHDLIIEKYGAGYEVGGQGLEIAREIFFDFTDDHYGFSRVPGLKEKLTNQSAITNGGMGALSIIASTMVHRAMDNKEGDVPKPMHHRFCTPDNSFGTWKNIIKLISQGREENLKTIGTKQENKLHPSPDDIKQFYKENPIPEEGIMETWCLTPVSNPGGTKVDPQMLKATIEEITTQNPNATIILDSVYIRTLNEDEAQGLTGPILEDPKLLEKIIFVESFSKSHGVCGLREGIFFTANQELFTKIQNQNMTLFAGPGLEKSALLLALCTASNKENAEFNRAHEFWAAERKGLYTHLMQPKFSHLFEEQQPHIVQEQLDNPLGLYVFLKLKPDITFKEVALETHIIGIEEKGMAEGAFMRFAVGTLTEPTYSAPENSPQRNVGQLLHSFRNQIVKGLQKAKSFLPNLK